MLNSTTEGLHQRTLFFILILILFSAFPLSSFAEDTFQFSFGASNKLKITERSDIRARENGKYIGFTYNESRAVLDYMLNKDGYSLYSGNFYVYEASKKDTRLIANPINLKEYCDIRIDEQGRYKVSEDQFVPILRSFPVFPAHELKAGDEWNDFGERIVDPDNSGSYTKVRFYCQYRYDGLKQTKTGLKHFITAQYAMRYKAGDSFINDPELKEISGIHRVSIVIDDSDYSSIFMRDKLDEKYVYFDGRVLEHSGFILTWYNDIIGMDRGVVAEEASTAIEDLDIEDIDVVEREEGVAISIQNLHFVPDSPRILPEEKDRIGLIFDVLNKIEVKKILVAGHTADVGTKESQYILSEKRALTVINELVKKGMNPSVFIYEGRGSDQPLGDNSTEEGRALNRRVELILLDD